LKLVREHIYEKFIEDSDPVSDMGIGKFEVGDTVKLKDNLEVGKKYGNARFWHFLEFPGKLHILKLGKFTKNILLSNRCHYSKEMLDLVRKGSVNEKFTEDSDPIKDMGIGLEVGDIVKPRDNLEYYSAEYFWPSSKEARILKIYKNGDFYLSNGYQYSSDMLELVKKKSTKNI
jgi:hypothetical protein